MARYEHTGGAAVTQLAAPITATDQTFTVLDGSGYPTGVVGHFWVVLGATSANEEKVLCSERDGNNFTVAAGGRGGDGTVATPHSPPEQVRHIFTAVEADDANLHVNSNSGVHGVTSEVVGRTDTQELRNKILSGAFNTFSDVPLAAVTGLAARLDTSYWMGVKVADNVIATGVQGSPGTLSTLVASGITTPPGGHSSTKRVPVDGLYLVNYRLRYAVDATAPNLEIGDFRLILSLNPADPSSPVDMGSIVAQHQTRHDFTGSLRTHVRTSLSINVPSGSTQFVDTLNLGQTLPSVPHYVGVNLYSGVGQASGWDIRTDEYTTSQFRLIMDRNVATVGAATFPLRIVAFYGGSDDMIGHTVEMSHILSLNEGDVIAFRLWNNGTVNPVTVHGDPLVSAASIFWLGPR